MRALAKFQESPGQTRLDLLNVDAYTACVIFK